VTDSKGRIMTLEVHHSEQFKQFKENEQEKKTSLKRKQDEVGNYSILILCRTNKVRLLQ